MPSTHTAPFAIIPQPTRPSLVHPQPRRVPLSLVTDLTLRLDTQNVPSYSYKTRGGDREYRTPPPPPPSPISW